MGSKKDLVNALVERCRAVDWEVTMGGGGHWRVKTHTGSVFSIAGSSSDVHGMKNAERRAIRHGLAAREQEYALAKEKKRLERLEEDRARGVNWEEEEKKIATQKKAEPRYGYVDGVAVLERVPARAAHPRSPDKSVDIKHGVELALADDTVIFECVHPVMVNHKYQDCGRQFESANSLRTHISWHARVLGETEDEVIESKVDDEPKTITEELADMGQKIGFLANTAPVEEASESKRGVVAELIHLGEHAQSLLDELNRVGDELDTIRQGVSVLREDIAKAAQRAATDNVDIDELREKAARYDQIIKLTQ